MADGMERPTVKVTVRLPEIRGDRTWPHQFPRGCSPFPGDVVAWTCQACGEWIDESSPTLTDCTIDWRGTAAATR